MNYYELLEKNGFTVSGRPISFNKFKELCTAMDYGKGKKKHWIIYLGVPNSETPMLKVYPYMISFEGEYCAKADNIREAYHILYETAMDSKEYIGVELEYSYKYQITY